jgi:hypothetical protein
MESRFAWFAHHAAAVSAVPGRYSPGEHYDATHYHGGYAYRGGYGYHGGCGYRPYGMAARRR